MFSIKRNSDNDFSIGIFSKTTDSSFIEATGIAGLDFIILDCEHGPISAETLQNHIRAAQLANIAPIVRVSQLDSNSIGSALDLGASGVQIPNIGSAEQAKIAVESARFHPMGNRGVCRFVKSAGYGSSDKLEYFEQSNKAKLILQVEGLEGVSNIDSILKVKGFDVLFIGPYDLSQSVGKPGQVNSPEVLSLMHEIALKAKEKNIILGTFCDTLENASLMRTQGFSYIAYSVDINIYLESLLTLKKELNK